MKDSKKLLTTILNTTQIGQAGISSVLGSAMRPSLRKALEAQLQEYGSIESEARAIAASRSWELRDADPAIRSMKWLTVRARLSFGHTDSKVAAMVIQGSTRGMIQGLRDLHQYNKPDSQVAVLSQKLLDCETANIRQMQGFL